MIPNQPTQVKHIIANEETKINTNAIDRNHLRVDWVADSLVEAFNSPQSRQFYCLVAYRLPEDTINRLKSEVLERPSIRNPAAYFNTVARKEMSKRP